MRVGQPVTPPLSPKEYVVPVILHTTIFVVLHRYGLLFGPWTVVCAALLWPLTAAYCVWQYLQARHETHPGIAKAALNSGIAGRICSTPFSPDRQIRLLFWTTFVAGTCFLSLLCASLSMMSLSLWCAYPRPYRQFLCSEAYRIHRLLEQGGIRSWLTLGSLLGYQRYGNMIPWEHDADLGFPEEELDKVVDLLLAAGEKFMVRRRNMGGLGIWIPVRPEGYYYERDGEPTIVDLWTVQTTPAEFEMIEYCQGHKFPVQKDRHEALIAEYGPDYMIPRYDHQSAFCGVYLDS